VLGRLKNLGVYWSERMFGRGDWVYVCDNDGYYMPGWDLKLIHAFQAGDGIKLLGPYRHPYHLPNRMIHNVAITDAVQGLGHMMSWDTWDTWGSYPANAPGTNQSEDYAICRRIVEAGFLVGSIQPEVVHNCGLTDTQGKPCVGIETMTKLEGVYYE